MRALPSPLQTSHLSIYAHHSQGAPSSGGGSIARADVTRLPRMQLKVAQTRVENHCKQLIVTKKTRCLNVDRICLFWSHLTHLGEFHAPSRCLNCKFTTPLWRRHVSLKSSLLRGNKRRLTCAIRSVMSVTVFHGLSWTGPASEFGET